MDKQDYGFRIHEKVICIEDTSIIKNNFVDYDNDCIKKGEIFYVFGYGGNILSLCEENDYTRPRLHTNVESFIKLQDWRQKQLEKIL
jgi:hypothetical protein